jgi:hypothetical protein
MVRRGADRGPGIGPAVDPVDVRDAGEIERAVAAFARGSNGGVIVTASALGTAHRELIATVGGPAQAACGLPQPWWSAPLAFGVGFGALAYGSVTDGICITGPTLTCATLRPPDGARPFRVIQGPRGFTKGASRNSSMCIARVGHRTHRLRFRQKACVALFKGLRSHTSSLFAASWLHANAA